MLDFVREPSTKVYFGKGQVRNLGEEVRNYANKVLLVYGGGSIKKNSIYDAVVEQLRENNIKIFELSGIKPNPRIESVIEGIKLCKENNIEAVIPIGGGSAIDCSKTIAASVFYQGDPWDLVIGKSEISDALPIFAVSTMAATGSETDSFAVITNPATKEKICFADQMIQPKVAIMDPTYTFSVSKKQTASGLSDMMSHIMESYFSLDKSAYSSDRFAESLLKTCIKYGPIVLEQPENYEARANLMWVSSLAIDGSLDAGKNVEWSVHSIEETISGYYDIPHGMGLAVLTPYWMDYVLNEKTVDTFATFGINVWGIDSSLAKEKIANKAIEATRDFFNSIGMPSKLSEFGIGEEYIQEMALKSFGKDGLKGGFVDLTVEDVRKILVASL